MSGSNVLDFAPMKMFAIVTHDGGDGQGGKSFFASGSLEERDE